MAREWRELTVQDFAEVIGGGTPSTKDSANFGGEIPWITPKDLSMHSGKYIAKGERSITKLGLESSAARVLPFKAVLLTTRAPVGYLAIAAEELATNQGFHSLVVRDGFSPEFVYYLLLNDVERLRSFAVGSTFQELSGSTLRKMNYLIPPLSEQCAIAHILGTLDDKIELNRRMNETLEAMARALFKSWFIDFDPVHAKAEGRDPGLPADIAALFPDSFQDSELGEIPKGWYVGRMGDVLQQRVERTRASAETVARPYVPIECISHKSLALVDSKPGEEARSSLILFNKGDLLFGAMRPYFHKVCITPFDGTTRTTAFVLYPRRKGDFAFSTLLLHRSETVEYATQHSTGSTIPYAEWGGSLENMSAALSPSRVRDAFGEIVNPVLARIQGSYFEDKTLTSLRDTLLPKLLSGELRVKDVDELMEAHV